MLDAIEVIYAESQDLNDTRKTVNRFLGKPIKYSPIHEATRSISLMTCPIAPFPRWKR